MWTSGFAGRARFRADWGAMMNKKQITGRERVAECAVPTYQNGARVEAHTLLSDLDATGLVVLRNLDPSNSDAILEVANLVGTLDLGIDEELLGPVVMELRYDPRKTQPETKPAYFTSNFFPLHTDVSYVPMPPKFMLLHCSYPDPGGGGVSLMADCDAAAERISETDREALSRPVFHFLYPPNCPAGESAAHAIHEPRLWRFKHAAMRIPATHETVVDRFHQALTQVTTALFLERGDLLIADNHRIAHGRTAFNPSSVAGPARHIFRVYAGDKSAPPLRSAKD